MIKDPEDVPSNWSLYNILVLASTGFPYNIHRFQGQLLVTIDYGTAWLIDHLAGRDMEGELYGYDGHVYYLDWKSPWTEREDINWNDGHYIYADRLNDIPYAKPTDIYYAVDSDFSDRVHVALFNVSIGNHWFYWLHLGCYDDDHPDTPHRQTQLILDALERLPLDVIDVDDSYKLMSLPNIIEYLKSNGLVGLRIGDYFTGVLTVDDKVYTVRPGTIVVVERCCRAWCIHYCI